MQWHKDTVIGVVIAHTQQNKKYECRIGPFECFFISTVEFCKHDTVESSLFKIES